MAETCYIVTIEGVGLNDGGATPTQVKYCTLIPDYAVADDEYIQALKQEPSGVASKWDVLNQTITVGDFTLTFNFLLTATFFFSSKGVAPQLLGHQCHLLGR